MKRDRIVYWEKHSFRYLEMAMGANRLEAIVDPDGYGKNTGGCGDTVEMFLTVRNGSLKSIAFRIDGCVDTYACANTVAHLAEGKGIDWTWDITPGRVIEYLETLPEEAHHCAELAVGALYRALADYEAKPNSR